VSKELWACHKEMGLGLAELKQIITSGFKSAFLPFHVKQQYLRTVTEELKTFSDEGLPDRSSQIEVGKSSPSAN